VIPTRNRKEHLREAVRSSLAQSVPVEVIVLDDGSDDGTPEMMAGEFPTARYPQVRYRRFEGPNGPSYLRTVGSEMAATSILFPIDDDSVFQSAQTVAQTLAEFDDARVGAVGIPFINVRQDNIVRQRAPDDTGVWVAHAYVGCAHALRRDIFLRLGGYHREFFYMGEEGDYCIRMLNAGYVVRIGRADAIHHHESPSRSLVRADTFGRRNDVLFSFYNVPLPTFPAHLAATTFNGIRFGLRIRQLARSVRGLLMGYAQAICHLPRRKPVSRQTYKLYRDLKNLDPMKLPDIEARLRPHQNSR